MPFFNVTATSSGKLCSLKGNRLLPKPRLTIIVVAPWYTALPCTLGKHPGQRIQPTDAGQTELAAVRMPAKHQIYARLRICSKALWMMRQKDPKALLTFQQPAERWEQNLLPISPLSAGCTFHRIRLPIGLIHCPV